MLIVYKMRKAAVYYNKQLAGMLTEENHDSYVFEYEDSYYLHTAMPPVSLTLPKTKQRYHAKELFPFFYNMLAEGVNKQLQSRQFHIDENDAFGLLLATAGSDTIGAITVKPMTDELARN
jgi:HipA-like protein